MVRGTLLAGQQPLLSGVCLDQLLLRGQPHGGIPMASRGRLKEGGKGPPPEGKPNWANQTIWIGDNLDIMRGMNSASVDLIYLDPPFNSKTNYAAPIGSKAAGAAFKDTWGLNDISLAWHGEIKHERPGLYSLLTAAREIHGESMMSYLIYMAIRVMEMQRLLKPAGSIYLHCDPTASHYLKLLMDATFGRNAFRNEIVWSYGGRGAKAISRQFPRNHDIIFYYALPVRGRGVTYNRAKEDKEITSGYRLDDEGRPYKTAPRGDHTGASIEKLEAEGRIHRTGTGKVRVKYFLKRAGERFLIQNLCLEYSRHGAFSS